MPRPLVSLDHLGVIVPDLARAAGVAEAFGFTLTEPGGHRAEGHAQPGSQQRSIMFADGYIELQTIADLAGAHPLAPAARRFLGNHILAFGVGDAAKAHTAVKSAGIVISDVLQWSRPISESDLAGEARFAFFLAGYGGADDAFLCWVEHRTPQLLRNPRLVSHANGALRLDGVLIAAEHEPAALARRYAASGGTLAGQPAATAVTHFVPGFVEIATRARLPAMLASAVWPAPDWIATPVIAVRDLAAIADRADRLGHARELHGGRLYVDLGRPLGVFAFAAG